MVVDDGFLYMGPAPSFLVLLVRRGAQYKHGRYLYTRSGQLVPARRTAVVLLDEL
jgi:hypothetical protein